LFYQNTLLGKITKFFLECFGMWNDGNTTAIVSAEDFLIKYDSRFPLTKDSKGNYCHKFFFFLTCATWVRNNLDVSRFYNYNLTRTIRLVQNFRFDTFNPSTHQGLSLRLVWEMSLPQAFHFIMLAFLNPKKNRGSAARQ
jgi:hypothetical protein